MGARRVRALQLVIVGAMIALAMTAWGATPMAELRVVTDRVIEILRDPALKPPSEAAARRAAIVLAVEPVFDLPEMARRALGLHWRERTEAERTQFTHLFTELLEHAYISKIESYGGEKVVYLGESVDDGYATVRTTIRAPRGTETFVDYRMLQRDGRWRVFDVSIEGVSLVEDYRVQFNRIIDESSYANLVKRITARLDELHVR